jgi:DNA-binding SARP family transcriptional activator/tetratricopeptide (TPR) repeat protein
VVEFRLLGPLEAVENGQSMHLGGRQQRTVLVVMLLRRNEVVPTDQLIDAIWGARPPPTASVMVQLYVSRLRKLLGRERLLTRPAGYVLEVDSSQVDAARFETLVTAAARSDDAGETARLLREALALWRGPPLVDFAYDTFAEAESRRLEELRLAALEDRIEADLALGREIELVAELEALLVAHPFRERPRGQLMVALYRSGRQADALEVYRDGRRVLSDELGLEPSPALRELERQILDHDPALAPTQREPKRAGQDERKVVTALFADVAATGGTPLDLEEAQAVLEPFRARARTELARFGGTVEILVGGTVAAFFGTPVTHEDDPERAVRAALTSRDVVTEAGRDAAQHIEVRIGIATGEVLIRGDRDGRVIGEAVSTADHIRANAPANTVLVAEATHRATADVIEFEAEEPISGRSVWRAVAPSAPIRGDRASTRTVPLVGRDAELDLIRDLLRATRSETQPFTLIGEPGLGKTRLLSEARQAAEGVRWLQGRSIPYGDGVAYHALAEIVKAVAGILDTDAPARAAEKIGRAVHSSVEEDPANVEAQLRVLLGLESLDTSFARSAVFAAWRCFVAGLAAQQPLVLAFEDVHWADDGLLDFIEELRGTRTATALLVICTARPELLERRPDWGSAIELSPLSEADTRILLSALLGGESPPEALEAAVARIGGNPLFAEEYARAVARGDTGDVPESVHQVIAARLDQLAPEDKLLLQEAAVVGEVFWPGALASINGLDAAARRRRLDELARREFVAPEPTSAVANEQQYLFRHVLIRDVAYAGIPRAQRAVKHQETAEWIEARARDDDVAELVAHHYSLALDLARAARLETEGLVERATEAFWRAGERARQVYAHAEAAEYFRRALTVLDEVGDPSAEWLTEITVALCESLGDVLVLTGQPEEAEEAFTRAGEFVSNRDRVRRARLLRKQGQSLSRFEHRQEDSAAAYTAAETALGKRPSGKAWWEERCEIACSWLHLLYFIAPIELLRHRLNTYRPMVERHGTAWQRASVLSVMGNASLRSERYVADDEGVEYVRAALAAARESGNVGGSAVQQFALGFALLWAARLDEAEIELTEALLESERIGAATLRTPCLTYLTHAYRKRGDVVEVRRLAELALEAARTTHMEEYVAQAYANLAWVAWREGDHGRAEELARAAWTDWDDHLRRVWAWMPVFPLLGLALRAGRDDEARKLAEVLVDPTRQPLPAEVEDALRAGRLTEAATLAAAYGYL